jgi:hypothetical protein
MIKVYSLYFAAQAPWGDVFFIFPVFRFGRTTAAVDGSADLIYSVYEGADRRATTKNRINRQPVSGYR